MCVEFMHRNEQNIAAEPMQIAGSTLRRLCGQVEAEECPDVSE
jgi:hypothetical protein